MRDRQCASRDSNDAVGPGAVSTVVIVGGALLLGQPCVRQTVRRVSETVFCGENNACESVDSADLRTPPLERDRVRPLSVPAETSAPPNCRCSPIGALRRAA
jgi:hypothetical protein